MAAALELPLARHDSSYYVGGEYYRGTLSGPATQATLKLYTKTRESCTIRGAFVRETYPGFSVLLDLAVDLNARDTDAVERKLTTAAEVPVLLDSRAFPDDPLASLDDSDTGAEAAILDRLLAYARHAQAVVRASAARRLIRLGQGNITAVSAVLGELARDPADGVRQAVAMQLEAEQQTESIPILVGLSEDSVDEVRYLAISRLSSWRAPEEPEFIDTSALRNALARRLGDALPETRAEAVLGLAKRRDVRALPVLRAALEDSQAWEQYLEAARYFAAADLLPSLHRWSQGVEPAARELWQAKWAAAMAACGAGQGGGV